MENSQTCTRFMCIYSFTSRHHASPSRITSTTSETIFRAKATFRPAFPFWRRRHVSWEFFELDSGIAKVCCLINAQFSLTAYVLFNMMFLLCSILGSISSVLVFIGLKKDQREFLVPWILVMTLDIIVDILYFLFAIFFENMKFEPLTGMIFTFQFFVIFLNVRWTKQKKRKKKNFDHSKPSRLISLQMYCLVCVVSQYQEYKIGRGLISNQYVSSCYRHLKNTINLKDFSWCAVFPFLLSINRQSNGVSLYKAPEKSCIILHQSKTSPMNNGHTNFTLIQESQKNGSASKCFIIPVDWSHRLAHV